MINLFKNTLQEPPAGSSAGDAWSEVGQQFKLLGQSLAAAFKSTVANEESRQHAEKIQAELDSAANEIAKAVKKATDSEEARKVQADVEKAAQSAVTAGKQTVEEMRPHLLAAFQSIRTELDKAINRMEQAAPDETEDDQP